MSGGLKKAAVFCLMRSGGRFLLLRRAKQPNQGKYVPPGGKIDPHEKPADALVREIREETGMIISNPTFCGVLTETSPTDYNWISYIYVADTEMFDPPACDEGEFFWIDNEALTTVDTPPTDRYIYQYVAAGTPFVFSAEFDENLNMIVMIDELTKTIVYPMQP